MPEDDRNEAEKEHTGSEDATLSDEFAEVCDEFAEILAASLLAIDEEPMWPYVEALVMYAKERLTALEKIERGQRSAEVDEDIAYLRGRIALGEERLIRIQFRRKMLHHYESIPIDQRTRSDEEHVRLLKSVLKPLDDPGQG